MKKRPFRAFEKENEVYPFTGTMAEESFLRQKAWLQNGCNNYDGKRLVSNPLSFWTEQDILQYILTEKIPIATVYKDIITADNGKLQTTGCERTGCMFCMFGVHLEKGENRFQRMKLTHPKQHNYCIGSLGCGKVLDYIGVPYE